MPPAGYKCLARRGCLPTVRRDGGISGQQIELIDGRAKGVGAYLRNDRVRALTDIHRSLVQDDPSITLQAETNRGGIREGCVPASVPHASDAYPLAQWSAGRAVKLGSFRTSRVPARAQGLKTFANANSFSEHLSGR